MPTNEELESLRLPFVAGSELRWNARRDRALICNLSCGGVLAHVDRLPEGEVEVDFPLPDDGPPVHARAAVRWSGPAFAERSGFLPVACGLGFVEIEPEIRERIARLARRYRQQPVPAVGIAQPRSGILRVPLILPCRFRSESTGVLRGKTCNVSAFGVYVTLERELELGSQGQLELDLPPPVGSFAPRVTVAWRNPDLEPRPHALPVGCGLRFEGLGRTELAALVRVVDELLAQVPRGRG